MPRLCERVAHVRGGGCWKSPLRHAFGMTPPPKGEARLGSPFGGAVAVRRLRGQPASASTQPMCRGRWQLALSVLANASPPPPKGEARLGFLQTFSSAPTWLPLWGPLRPGGTLPSGRSPLPRRSVMGAAHWVASPEPAGESALLWRAERVPHPLEVFAW